MAKKTAHPKDIAGYIIAGISSVLLGIGALFGLNNNNVPVEDTGNSSQISSGHKESFDIGSVPAYNGEPYVEVNNNVPFFKDMHYTEEVFETYSGLDKLGRCGPAFVNICEDVLPISEREKIGTVKPSGWQMSKYDIIEGKYLYNRCHLIGFQLAGENDNEKNLVTGTAYMNVTGMLPFENMVADYVEETENHVLYRVTPIYDGANLVVSGVLMEAKSVEDNGEDLMFCVYVYNVQPGIVIDYKTGESRLSTDPEKQPEEPINPEDVTYILNVGNKKFHLPDCSGVATMKESNKKETDKTREELIEDGYTPCGTCKP
jgi:DNA-entry nuclease